MTSEALQSKVTDHLKDLYAAYRRTIDIDAKGLFFSLNCAQVCRPKPSYAASDRATIVRYLHDASEAGLGLASSKNRGKDDDNPKKKSFATIRSLRTDEFKFGTDEQVAPAGFATAGELKQRAEDDGWVGMRVDLWDEEVVDGQSQGMLVKVQYWWTEEEGGWTQILHDIMYIGPLDGTQGSEGDILE